MTTIKEGQDHRPILVLIRAITPIQIKAEAIHKKRIRHDRGKNMFNFNE
jgi:hypothetical protein